MNDEYEVYIQIEDADGPHATKVRDDDTIIAVLARHCGGQPHANHQPDLLAVFVEDDEQEVHKDRKFCEIQPNRPKILHCHRCREVNVTVFYNGEESCAFRPNTRIRRVIEWAKKKFEVDASRKWVLRTGSAEGEIQDPDTHLGKLVKHPECHVTLYLTERCLIQG